MLRKGTPLEPHNLLGREILVKREDLSCPPPGPPFSKVRGAMAHIQAQDASTIGVLDTYHSKAGWAVAFICRQLGKRCINFWPMYKHKDKNWVPGDPPPREPQQKSLALGADLHTLPAGPSWYLYHQARAVMALTPNSYLMPNALKLPESITENAAEVCRTPLPPKATLVLSISSGTIAAGVLKGLDQLGLLKDYHIIIHLGYSRSPAAVRKYIETKSGVRLGHAQLVDEGYSYQDRVDVSSIPFPISPYYDAKAYLWLGEAIKSRQHWTRGNQPIVFWNVGE